MKHKIQNSAFAYILAFLVGGVSTASAAPGDLSQSPLFLQTSVAPNVFFLNDDSGSMRAEMMTEDFVNSGFLTSISDDLTPPLVHTGDCSTSDSQRIYLFILQKDSNDCFRVAEEEWRARLYHYNRLYYNPNRIYLPWAGKNDITDLTQAPIDPNDATADNIDLTSATAIMVDGNRTNYYSSTAWQNWCTSVGRTTDCVGWRYYTWTDDGDTIIENDELTITWVKDLTSAEDKTNFANWFSYHRNREFAAKYAIGNAINQTDFARIGYGTINESTTNDGSGSDGGWSNGGDSNTVEANNYLPIDYLNSFADSSDTTSHKEDLLNQLYNTTSNPSFGTPLRSSLKAVGDYYDTGNLFGDNVGTPILNIDNGGACQSNHTILMTDGFYNGPDPDDVVNDDGDNNTDFDGGIYADSYSDTLADVAMYYYERDLSDLANEVPTTSTDTATHQHMNTYTVAFGVEGTLDSSADPSTVTWPDPTTDKQHRIDDLFHAAVNGRGNYFSASDPNELVQALLTLLAGLDDPAPSATSVAMSSFQLESEDLIFSSKFKTGEWYGELIAHKIGFNNDGSFSFTEEWNAAIKLKDNNDRHIYTYKENASGNGTGVLFDWDSIAPAAVDDPDLQALLNAGDSATVGEKRLNYLRGVNYDEFRQRTFVLDDTENSSPVYVLLGDIVNSSPVYVAAPASPYPDTDPYGADGDRYFKFWNDNKDRTPMIYVGANDGMLHGFRAKDTAVGADDGGEELMAYVPATLFPKLHKLTDRNYIHQYFVDQTPTVADAYFNSDWHTVLVNGLGAGGRGIFALDITDPDIFTNSAGNAEKNVLWEFNSDDDNDLGYTLSEPVIALTHEGWAVIVGNGYNSDSGIAKLFIIKLHPDLTNGWTLGTDYYEISTEVGDSTNKNGLSSPTAVDTDGNGKVDRVYAGDLEGNLWAFNLSDGSESWNVAYLDGTTPQPLFQAKNAANQIQPITVKTSVIHHPHQPTVINESNLSDNTFPNLMIYFGTGQYLTSDDLNNTQTQTFYGVWDKGNSALTRSNLVEKTISSGTDSTLERTARITSNEPVSYGVPTNTERFGWRIDLDTPDASTGERVITNAVVINDIVFFTTYIPNSDPCNPGGSSWFMFVNAHNGGTPDEPVINVTRNDRDVDVNDMVTLTIDGETKKHVPSGLLIKGTLGAPSLDMGDGNTGTVLLNTADGLEGLVTDVGAGALGKRISWRELRSE